MNDHRPTFTLYANSGGCPQNQLDGAHVVKYLTNNGYTFTRSVETADIVVINSCAYKSAKEAESFEAYRSVLRRCRKDAKIVFSGCLPKIAPARLEQLDARTVVIPGTDLQNLETVVAPLKTSWSASAPNQIPEPALTYVKPFRKLLSKSLNGIRGLFPYSGARHFDRMFMYDHSAHTHIVRVAQGCLGSCTYCAIRFSRGTLKSKPLPAVLAEVRKAVDRNVPEILLSATDLAAYGRDLGLDLSDMLRAILEAAPKQYLLLFYANPRWLIDIWDKLEPLFATERIHFIHLSLNGGSDHVLKQMGRGYTLAEFERLTGNIKRVSPGTVLQTQILTGFPGETEEDFEETVAFLHRNFYHNVQVHAFDPRPGTVAATMKNQIATEIREKRRRRLYRQTLAAKLRYNVQYILNRFEPTQVQ